MGDTAGRIVAVAAPAVGAFFGGPAGAAAGAAVGSLIVGQEAARAQGDAANVALGQQREDRSLALNIADPSAQELAQLSRLIQLNEADIARKEKLLASSDPALIEAGKQAKELLDGADAKILGPIRSQLAKQEQTLRQKLQQQLGTGYETTTAGSQALNSFREGSSNVIANAQQQSLAQLLGIAQNTSANYGFQSNIANTATAANLTGNLNERKLRALQTTPITMAGAEYVGQIQSDRNIQQTLNQLMQVYGTASPFLPKGSGAPASGSYQPNFSNQPTGASQPMAGI